MGWKKFLIGEKMPDASDPKNEERVKRDMAVGAKFARLTRFDKLMVKIHTFGTTKPKYFFTIYFSILGVMLVYHVANLVSVARNYNKEVVIQEAVDRQHQLTIKAIEQRNKKIYDRARQTQED